MSLPSHLSSLTLVHLLREWGPVPGEPARQDVAQRLGDGLSAFDSVKLDGALQAIASYGAHATRQLGQPVEAPALDAACKRVKAELTDLITTRVMAITDTDADTTTNYGKHHQRYADLQKQMDAKVGACRALVRQALSKGSPRMRQLAALDSVMADMFGEREQKLLAAVPVYLERRFAHWQQASHPEQALAGGADDEKAPNRWLHGFQQDMRQMLLAELQVRLQPILGLIEAVQVENKQS